MPARETAAAGAPDEADVPGRGEAATDDDALILWMLSLDAAGRLEVAQGFADSVEALRHGRRG